MRYHPAASLLQIIVTAYIAWGSIILPLGIWGIGIIETQ